MTDCLVIIPFYQNQGGVLTRALESVFNQTYQSFNVLVVDDQSPLAAEIEVSALPPEQQSRITVIHQANKGPGGARNSGLDTAVLTDCKFIAFLDSDDIWQPTHLSEAREAILEMGAETYWGRMHANECDAYQPYLSFSKMEKTLIKQLKADQNFYEIIDLKRAMLIKWWQFFHMSTFAAARPVFMTVRFDESFRIAAEDALFFFSCAMISRKTIVCDTIACTRGQGANLFHGAVFGTKKTLLQLYYSRQAIERIAALGNFDNNQAIKNLEEWRAETRESGASCALHAILRGRINALPLLGTWLRQDPQLLLAIFRRARNRVQSALSRSKFGF